MRILRLAALVGASLSLAGAQSPDPWSPNDLIAPEALASSLKSGRKPDVIVYVGFPVLYRAARIPGAVMAGPASKPDGLETLRKQLAAVPRDRQIVLYCGCCPWSHCPNVRPAFKLVRQLGFKQAKLLSIPENMHTDWISKGYPSDRSPAR